MKTGQLQARSSLLQADYRQKQADCRRKQAGCKPFANENKPVADLLQHLFFVVANSCSVLKNVKKGSEKENCLKIPSFSLQNPLKCETLHLAQLTQIPFQT